MKSMFLGRQKIEKKGQEMGVLAKTTYCNHLDYDINMPIFWSYIDIFKGKKKLFSIDLMSGVFLIKPFSGSKTAI